MSRPSVRARLRSHRLSLAVLLSVFVHATLFVWAVHSSDPSGAHVVAEDDEVQPPPIELEFVELDFERATPSPAAPAAASPSAVKRERRAPQPAPKRKEADEPGGPPTLPSEQPPEAVAESSSSTPPPEEAPPPRLESLVPRGHFIVGGPRTRGTSSQDAPGSWLGSTGRTVANDGPPDEATRRAQAEGRAREAMARVDGWAKDDLATLRVRNGATDDYFRELGNELERLAQVERPLTIDVKQGLQRVVEGYKLNLQQYGATGSPIMPEGLGDQRNHLDVPDPNRGHQLAAATADQYARVQELARRFGAGELVVIVELVQDAAGRVTGLVIARSSGDPLFDAHIQRIAQGMNPLEGMPDHVAARNPHGVRTTWEFRGRYNFRKKLRQMDVNDAGDAAYIAAMGLGSLFAGGAFDEVTGDIYIVDVRDPKFEVRATLLRLY